MKIVIPMAGRGTRFSGASTDLPKPLILVNGQAMFLWAAKSIEQFTRSIIIFIVLEEHEKKYQISKMIQSRFKDKAKVVCLAEVTEGQLCTVLAAKELIDNDEDLLIASSDTYVVSDLHKKIQNLSADVRGVISVSEMTGDQWSFVKTDTSGRVIEVAEKKRISNWASTGIYYFSSGHEFITIAEQIVQNKEKIKNEYYIIPVYQKCIDCGWQVEISKAKQMWDMGNPEALAKFEQMFKGVGK